MYTFDQCIAVEHPMEPPQGSDFGSEKHLGFKIVDMRLSLLTFLVLFNSSGGLQTLLFCHMRGSWSVFGFTDLD